MGKLIYSMVTSLDGYVSDPDGNFGWGAPDAELHRFITERSRSIGAYLYGRRMYQTMVYWETVHMGPEQPLFMLDYARIWQATDKIVYSTTLTEVTSERTRLERSFDPAVVLKLKTQSELDLTVDGPQLARQAIQAGLVDEYQLFVAPLVVGGGNPFFPSTARINLKLLNQRRFNNGVLYLRYGVKDSA